MIAGIDNASPGKGISARGANDPFVVVSIASPINEPGTPSLSAGTHTSVGTDTQFDRQSHAQLLHACGGTSGLDWHAV